MKLEDFAHCNRMGYDFKILKRFWSKVDIPDDYINECWLWTAGVNKGGYGRINIFGDMIKAHRFSFECYYGKIPKGKLIRHSCDTPPCVNPNHLLIGTHKDNLYDAIDRGRFDVFGEKNNNVVLTEEIVKNILIELYEGNANCCQLAKKYNVVPKTINCISRGITWSKLYNQLTEEQKNKIKNNNGINLGNAKLTSEDVQEIKKLLLTTSKNNIAKKFNVAPRTIYDIKVGRTWKHIHI
jgi:hypothetical protein